MILYFSEKSSWVIYSVRTLHWFSANTSSLWQSIHHFYSQSSLLYFYLFFFELSRLDYHILPQLCQTIFFLKGHLSIQLKKLSQSCLLFDSVFFKISHPNIAIPKGVMSNGCGGTWTSRPKALPNSSSKPVNVAVPPTTYTG